MRKLVAFSEHEAALLLDAYLKVLSGKMSRIDSVKECSQMLRQIAVNSGAEIDDIYRNVNGIFFQMASMESAYHGKTIMKPATQMFTKIVNLFKTDENEYQKLLDEAKAMADTKQSHRAAFTSWLVENASPSQLSDLLKALVEIEKRAKKLGLVKESLYDELKPTVVEHIVSNIERSQVWKLTHYRQWPHIHSALDYLFRYVNSKLFENEMKKSSQDKVCSGKTIDLAQDEIVNVSVNSVNCDSCGTEENDITDIKLKEIDSNEKLSNNYDVIDCKKFDLKTPQTVKFTKPVRVIFREQELIGAETSWSEVYVTILSSLYLEYKELFPVGISFVGAKRTDLCNDDNHTAMVRPREISSNVFLETNLSAKDIVKRIQYALNLCHISSNELVIFYKLLNEGESKREKQSSIEYKSKKRSKQSLSNNKLKAFESYLLEKQNLEERTCKNYCSSIIRICEYIREYGMDYDLLTCTAEEAKRISVELMSYHDFIESNSRRHNQLSVAFRQYINYLSQYNHAGMNVVDYAAQTPKDERWQPILTESFPDGYILDDFLSQFQASAFWQERYGETCPIEGINIDCAMKSIGNVRDGRVFSKCEGDNELLINICTEINKILSLYSCVYRNNIYERYQNELATYAIYTESVMTQQLIENPKCDFYSTYQVFARYGKDISVADDCKKVLREHGGALAVNDIAKKLWFVPHKIVYHNLSVDDETINIGPGTWMLAEHFPLTFADAEQIGDVFDECFLSQSFIQQTEVMSLLEKYLPHIADSLSNLQCTAVFNILNYYLKDRFSFSKAIIAPKGTKTDFKILFNSYAKEHERFTLEELAAFAQEMNMPIYWESIFNGGAVRITQKEFVNQHLISFDIKAIDTVLDRFCERDYIPLKSISNAMMVHLPTCGYSWNGYLLLSYLYSFSKTFRLCYNSLSKGGYYGAMVRRNCKSIDSYEHLVEQILLDDNTWQTEDDVLSLLVHKGYQARHRLDGIVNIVAKIRRNKIANRIEDER